MPNGIKGRIFNIQRFSLHDGPGIRTIVFFKGCYMRCAWCCNPESQNREIETIIEKGKPKTVGSEVTVSDIMPEILSDTTFYRRSGGGVTLSGGEVLCQADFARELLKACKEEGLHTAVESAASAPFSEIDSESRIALAAEISSTGSSVSETLTVSPIPSAKSVPMPILLLTSARILAPASVTPRCKG